jgi:hypothetical protein
MFYILLWKILDVHGREKAKKLRYFI